MQPNAQGTHDTNSSSPTSSNNINSREDCLCHRSDEFSHHNQPSSRATGERRPVATGAVERTVGLAGLVDMADKVSKVRDRASRGKLD